MTEITHFPTRLGDLTFLRRSPVPGDLICRCHGCGNTVRIRERGLPNRKHMVCNTCAMARNGRATMAIRSWTGEACSVCRELDHRADACPKRVRSKFCSMCCGMPHRVSSSRCRECRLRYAPLPVQSLRADARLGSWTWV